MNRDILESKTSFSLEPDPIGVFQVSTAVDGQMWTGQNRAVFWILSGSSTLDLTQSHIFFVFRD